MTQRFPRPRGDGPKAREAKAKAAPVSPPTRGWTPSGLWSDVRPVGFPAHAGMDPWTARGSAAAWRFPRPRGDGPPGSSSGSAAEPVSPPTRGWTPAVDQKGTGAAGFPAHAGMDPSLPEVLQSLPRFPRPRGDGPLRVGPVGHQREVSPPTRGWTRTSPSGNVCALGFPAHAGMDPIEAPAPGICSGFPRPRGDGPPGSPGGNETDEVSPPTRGWTSGPRVKPRSSPGFPAHAGMDPRGSVRCWPWRRFPRPRGDGPSPDAAIAESGEVSPPTRGWTTDGADSPRACPGFPAHAGMDPAITPSRGRPQWFPRPRGDGPRRIRDQARVQAVSPPTRGWTVPVVVTDLNEEGFPAHAGMDPRGAPCGRPRTWFPRPRGDGPYSVSACCPGPLVSPPTRGWTRG